MVWVVRQTSPEVAVMTAAICSLGCYILACLCEQFRLCALGQQVSKVLSTRGLFMLMTLALGGVSIFSMNFLNLAAVSVPLPASDSAPAHLARIEFKTGPLCVSVVVSLLFAFLGLYVASHDVMFAKTKKQIVDDFILGAKDMTLKEVKAISSFKLFYIISTQSLKHLVLGGFLTGCGAAITACLTMWSLAIPDIELVWNFGIIVADLIFSCVFSAMAFWILFRLLSLYPRKEILRIVSALFTAFCFVSTHFIGMRAIQIRLKLGMAADDSPQLSGRTHVGHHLGFAVVLAAVVIFCFALLILSVVDLRSWLYESSSVLHKHEAMLLRLKGMHTDNFAIIAKHMREVELERSHHSSNASGSPRKASSLVTSASEAANMLALRLPLGRGRVTPRTGDDVSIDSTTSSVAGTPRFAVSVTTPRSSTRPPAAATIISMSSIAESRGEGSTPPQLTLRLPEEVERRGVHCQDEESPAEKHSE